MVSTSMFKVASKFIGMKEIPGVAANPQIVAMLRLEDPSITQDEVAWCSAFVNYIAWLLGFERSQSLAARSWLLVGTPTKIEDAHAEDDVVIFKRGTGVQPGPDVIAAPGHVGLFAGITNGRILVLGGNQGDSVSIESFSTDLVLGIRHLSQKV